MINKFRESLLARFRTRVQTPTRSVVLELSGPKLRLVVLEAGDGTEPVQVRVRSLDWRTESTVIGTDRGSEELTAAIKTLVTEEKLEGAAVLVTLATDLCFTLSATGNKDEIRKELRGLEERSASYIALGTGPKAISSSLQSIDARHEHVLASVANQRTVDALATATRLAGLAIERIEPTLVGLSRLLGHLRRDQDAPVLILNLHEAGAELGISFRGRLLLDYRPASHLQPSEAAEAVLGLLERLRRYCERYSRPGLGRIGRVFLFGCAASVHVAHDGLRRREEIEVHARNSDILDSRWKFDESVRPGEFAAALGTALVPFTPDAQNSGPNLVEQFDADRLRPLGPDLIRSAIPVAAALVISLLLWGAKQFEQHRCEQKRSQMATLGPNQSRTQELWHQIQQAEQLEQYRKTIRDQLKTANWVKALSSLAHCAPDDLWLNRFQVDASGKISLGGTTFEENSIHEFISWLEGSPDWDRVELVSTRPSQFRSRPSIEFDIECGTAARSPGAKGAIK